MNKIIINEAQFHDLINENFEYSNKIIISVDIQEEYANYLPFNTYEYGNFLNLAEENGCTNLYLYNGEDLGFGNENEQICWLFEECGVEESTIDNMVFFEKGYAFFRDFMDDDNVDNDVLIILADFMIKHDIRDIRDLTDEDWEMLINNNQDFTNIKELAEEGYAFYIPDVADFLQKYNDVYICGGSDDNQCLTEIEILLNALHKKYYRIEKFIYR